MVVSSCASRVETQRTFPDAADLQYQPEPAYPLAALDPSDAGKAAEDAWRDEVLIWGRTGWRQNARVCKWAVDLGLKVPAGYCGP